jgi:hypothetical protein
VALAQARPKAPGDRLALHHVRANTAGLRASIWGVSLGLFPLVVYKKPHPQGAHCR